MTQANGLFTEAQRQVREMVDIDHVATLFGADPDIWTPSNVSTTFWEQQKASDTEPSILGCIRASFTRNPAQDARIAETVYEQAVADMRKYRPEYDRKGFKSRFKQNAAGWLAEEPVAFVESINDAHVGNLSWRHETGKDDYDIGIAIRDYEKVNDDLVRVSTHYDAEEIIVLLGNDFSHIDFVFNKTGQTFKGTPQDFDSRIPKIITAIRRLSVRQIDLALARKPRKGVTVVVVPGNHDRVSMYNLTETLYAWYRNVPEVRILNAPADGNYHFPRLRQYYEYGANGIMFAHGENFNRGREPLPLIFADEAPEIWASTVYREVLCGHQHKTEAKGYARPKPDLTETRGVRMRALPGLTAVDAWHDDQGYSHWRAATGLAYKQSGGVAGLHEVEP